MKNHFDNRSLTTLQVLVMIGCFLMNTLDGMDVLVMSFTAPAISKAWAVSPIALGGVFSAGLFGMAVGTVLLAPLADKYGRKTIILISGLIMGICIYLTSFSETILELMIFRFVSGLGIGSMLATTASLSAEYAPNKTRDFWVSFVISGYPIGAVLAGLVASKIIPVEGWQQMFKIAGIASLFSVPIGFLLLTESLDFYLRAQPKNALQKANSILTRAGIAAISNLPDKIQVGSGIPVNKLLNSKYKKPTLQLWIALFMAFASLYFLTSWIPKLAKDAGLSIELAIHAGTIFNVGAFFGIITQGYLSSRFGLKKTLGILLILTGILMASFGLFVGSNAIFWIFAFLGFGIQGGFVGLYALSARLYPTEFRTTGVGFAMGAGRVGGIVGPAFAGLLITAGLGIAANFLIFSIPALLSGIITSRIDSNDIS